MKTLQIWVYEYEGVLRSAVAGVKDIFDIANQFATDTQFTVRCITALADLPEPQNGVLFVLPSLHKTEMPAAAERNQALLSWYEKGGIIAATCASVFWLAEAGLLDGKVATTHWRLYEQLASCHPQIKAVDRRQMVVDQGRLLTAAGLYAFQDLVLHLIARFESYKAAREVADFALLDFNGRLQGYYQRFTPDTSHEDSVVLKTQRYCEQADLKELTVKSLAEHACVSERTLSRRYQSALNMSPGDYLQQIRIEKSKQLLSLDRPGTEQIAFEVGYKDLSNFSKAFKRIVGVTPAGYRQRLQGEY